MTWAAMWFWLIIPHQAMFAMYGEDACETRRDEPGSYCKPIIDCADVDLTRTACR